LQLQIEAKVIGKLYLHITITEKFNVTERIYKEKNAMFDAFIRNLQHIFVVKNLKTELGKSECTLQRVALMYGIPVCIVVTNESISYLASSDANICVTMYQK